MKGRKMTDMIAAEIEETGTYEPKDALIKVTVSQAEKDAVYEMATGLGITMSELVRRFIRKGLEESES